MPTNRKNKVDDDELRDDQDRDIDMDDEQGSQRRPPQQAGGNQGTGTQKTGGNQGRGSSNKKRK